MDGAVKVTFYGGSDTESPNYITAIMTCSILFYLFIYLFISLDVLILLCGLTKNNIIVVVTMFVIYW